jgi:hypothetical protein
LLAAAGGPAATVAETRGLSGCAVGVGLWPPWLTHGWTATWRFASAPAGCRPTIALAIAMSAVRYYTKLSSSVAHSFSRCVCTRADFGTSCAHMPLHRSSTTSISTWEPKPRPRVCRHRRRSARPRRRRRRAWSLAYSHGNVKYCPLTRAHWCGSLVRSSLARLAHARRAKTPSFSRTCACELVCRQAMSPAAAQRLLRRNPSCPAEPEATTMLCVAGGTLRTPVIVHPLTKERRSLLEVLEQHCMYHMLG